VRVVARIGHHQLVYRRGIVPLILMIALVVSAFAVGAPIGHLGAGALAAGLVVLAWLGYAMRLTRAVPAGPGGDGPAPPGGAAVREPRRPRPHAPARAAARPLDDEEPPWRAVAHA
jgi:hypothetical protein